MLLKVFLSTLVLMVFAGFGFGIKRLFNRNAELPASSCQSAHSNDNFLCGCGENSCSSESAN